MQIIDFNHIKKTAEEIDSVSFYNWVDEALKKKADFVMPPKPRISQADGDYYNIMPALYEDENIAISKMIGRHSIKRGEERSVMMGDLMLYEADTGILKAVMDAEYITTLRTGVVAAHSALLFAKSDFKVVSLLGLGNIMTVCFKTFIDNLRASGDDRELTVKLYVYKDQAEKFAKRFENEKNVKFVFSETYESLMEDADIIMSAVTRATENFASDNCYKEGVTIIPICTMGFQNCDLFFDRFFTDEIEQIRGFKYFDHFKELTNVSDVLLGNKPGRRNDKERILVYNYGIGIHDLYFAKRFFDLTNGIEVEYEYCKTKEFI